METTDDDEVYVHVICEERIVYDQIIPMKKSEFERFEKMLGANDIKTQLKAQRRIRHRMDDLEVSARDDLYIEKFAIDEEE